MFTCGSAFSIELPQEVKDFINKDFPQTDFRFDGAIILPDNIQNRKMWKPSG